MMARPSGYTPQIAAKICAELAQGKSLRTVCAMDGMPSIQTIFNWIHTNDTFLEQYTRAKEESADALVDEMQYLTDTVALDKDAINKARLQVETRKWISSKLKPKKYGDKLDMTSDGKPVSFVVTRGGKDGNSAS
jgi:hypothetical protein